MKYLKAIRDFAARSVMNAFITIWAFILAAVVLASVAPGLLAFIFLTALLGGATALIAWMIHDLLNL